jgi:glycosyltransferase involved in cell wall biosynthesis
VGSDKGNQAHVERAAKELGLDTCIHFLGFVSREDLVALYQNAFALAYVSWFGPENLPPLEAFALGCPVVASRIPGAEEQLGPAALFVAPENPEDIAAGIVKLHQDGSLRDRLVAAGTVRARQWTAKDYAAGVLRAIDQLEPVIRCWRPV